MKKITICFFGILALIILSTPKAFATVHVAMMDKEYLNELQKEYDARQKEIQEKRKKEKEQKSQSQNTSVKNVSYKSSRTSLTEEEVEILCKICHAESRGEGEKGQMAVANVILNRVKSSKFPNSISEVVFQKGQFTPASNRKSFNAIKPSAQVRTSVKKVLSGERVLSDDVLYFKSKKSSAKWGKYTLKATIGNHMFYAA